MEFTYTLRNVLLGSSILGATGGAIGSFALLRRQSLLGDALAHAALPGVCLAFLFTGAKEPMSLLVGALVAGVLGSLFILAVVRWSRVKEDSAIGIVLSVFYGAGILLLTHIQKLPEGNQSGLDKYLFGNASSLLAEDVQMMFVLSSVVLVVLGLFFKEFQVLTFDRGYASSIGMPVRTLEILLTCLLVVVVMVGLQTVGVVLMVATLITPPAAARQWTDRLGRMILVSALIGAGSGAVGAVASSHVTGLSTGPAIVLTSSTVLAASLLFSPSRGILWSAIRYRQVADRIRRENLLKDLWIAGERSGDWTQRVSRPDLMGVRGQSSPQIEHFARRLTRERLVEPLETGWRLTEAGRGAAEGVVRKHRLWELYLSRRLDLPPDHVHRDAEAMEHALSDEMLEHIEVALGHPTLDPHGRAIPPRRSP